MTTENKKSSYTILFVDDEEKTRKYFNKAIQADFDVLTAQNVEEAKKILAENHQKIGVVVTDQRMPGGNGVILLKHLKDNYPQIIRLLTTAYSDLDEAIEAVNKGEILRYIQKPWDFNMLKAELAQAMELFELRNEYAKLMQEKIAIRNKNTKMDRVKSLILLSESLKNLNFADRSISSFINDFSLEDYNVQKNSDENWNDQDFGSNDVSETKFLMFIASAVQNQLSKIENYDLTDELTIGEIKQVLEEAAKDSGANVNIEGEGNQKVKTNRQAIYNSFKALFAGIPEAEKVAVKIASSDNALTINVNVNSDLKTNNNLFFTSANNSNAAACVNLLLFYLLIGNHGKNLINFDNSNCLVTIPFNADAADKLSEEELEDVILSAMLEG